MSVQVQTPTTECIAACDSFLYKSHLAQDLGCLSLCHLNELHAWRPNTSWSPILARSRGGLSCPHV
eukprot:1031127-Amphidinium_carterae.1